MRIHSRRPRYAPRTTPELPTLPFISSEEAWFWYARCQQLRLRGARIKDGGSIARPCDPDDLARAVLELKRRRRISHEHVGVLARYGILERPPDPRRREEERAARLWDEGLDRLTTVLKKKGIVE